MKRCTLLISLGCVALASLLGGCQIGGSTVSEREGYFTWVDEQGQVRYSPINDSDQHLPPSSAAENQSASSLQSGDGAESSQPETEYTLENYPDADQLAKNGYVRPGERQPYYTWQDAQGNLRVSYYHPDTRTDEEKDQSTPPIELSLASVYSASTGMVPAAPIEGRDPNAFAVLGVEPAQDNYFSRFTETCCKDMSADDHNEWVVGREFGIHITNRSPTHNFLTGESPFQLIALSSVITRPDFIMQLRSYAQKGVFVPSLIFLDRDFVPMRLVTDLVSNYVPENWRRRGYLEAWVPVFPEQGERWLVIFTRSEDLEGQEVIETRKGPKAISHAATGELGLMMAE